MLILYGLETRFQWNPLVAMAFQPDSIDWWIANYRILIKVREKDGSLQLTVSKKAIEQLVICAINDENF